MASVTYGNGTSQTWQRDLASRLTGLRIDLAGTAADLVISRVGSTGTALACNPASQFTSVARSTPAYAYGGRYNVGRACTVNGRNPYATPCRLALHHPDALTSDLPGKPRLAWSVLDQG